MPGSFYTTGIVTVTGVAASVITALDRLLTGVSAVKKWDGASTFVDNTAEARLEGGTPFKLVDSNTEYLLVGFDVKGRALRFDIATAMSGGGAVTAEYWNGSAWTALTIVDGTSGWTVDGEITWTAPASWATSTVDSLLAYYVRFKCATNPSTDPTANFVVYNWTIYDGSAGTNTKVYKSIGEDGTKNLLLWVAHVAGDPQHARAILYESWDAALHTGAELSPLTALLSGGMYWRTSVTANATTRLVAAYISRDVASLYFYTEDVASQAGWFGVGALGTLLLAGDVWANVIWGGGVSGNVTPAVRWGPRDISLTTVGNGSFVAQRAYTGASGSVLSRLLQLDGSSSAGYTYPNPVDGGLIYQTVLMSHSTTGVRGSLTSAILLPQHNATLTDASDLVIGADTYRCLRLQSSAYGGASNGGPYFVLNRKD